MMLLYTISLCIHNILCESASSKMSLGSGSDEGGFHGRTGRTADSSLRRRWRSGLRAERQVRLWTPKVRHDPRFHGRRTDVSVRSARSEKAPLLAQSAREKWGTCDFGLEMIRSTSQARLRLRSWHAAPGRWFRRWTRRGRARLVL